MGATQCCAGPEQASKLDSDKLVPAIKYDTTPIKKEGESKEQLKAQPHGKSEKSSSALWKLGASATAELCSFRKFLKNHYASPGDAFDAMFKDCLLHGHKVGRDGFVDGSLKAGFEGDAGILFDLLKDNEMSVTRDNFKQILKNKGDDFARVVEQVMESKKLMDEACCHRASKESTGTSNSDIDHPSIASISTCDNTPLISPKMGKSQRNEGERSSNEKPEKHSSVRGQGRTKSRSTSPKLRARVRRSVSPKYPPPAEQVEHLSHTSKFHSAAA
jgi:hypothetical protein